MDKKLPSSFIQITNIAIQSVSVKHKVDNQIDVKVFNILYTIKQENHSWALSVPGTDQHFVGKQLKQFRRNFLKAGKLKKQTPAT